MKTLKNKPWVQGGLNKIFLLFILAPAISLLYSSCDESGLISQTRDLHTAKELWEKTNTEDYLTEIERVCFCPAPMRYIMKVEKGTIVEVLDSETGETVENITGYSTFDELFTWLERVAKQGPQKLDLEFHPELGYPTLIDYNQSDMIADEELLLKVFDFEKE